MFHASNGGWCVSRWTVAENGRKWQKARAGAHANGGSEGFGRLTGGASGGGVARRIIARSSGSSGGSQRCYHPPGAHLLILSKAAFSQSQVEAKRRPAAAHGKKDKGDPPGPSQRRLHPSQAARLLWHQRPARQASLRKTPSAWVRGLTASLCEFFLRSALPVLSCSPRICSTEAAQLADRRTPSTLLHHNSTCAPSNSLLSLLHHSPTLFRPTVVCLARARSRRLYGLGVRRG